MINVMVELVAHLKDGRFYKKELTLMSKTTVKDVFKMLNFQNEKNFIVILNGKHVDFDSILNQGDHLIFMPFVDGG